METESYVVREELRDGRAPNTGRHQASCKDMVQRATAGVGSTTRIPASEAIPSDVVQEMRPNSVWSISGVTKIRMTGIKITHVDHATGRWSGQSSQLDLPW